MDATARCQHHDISDHVWNLLEPHLPGREGSCWDHSAAERFCRNLKEALFHQQRYKTRDAAKQSIFEYIEVFYNQQRLHRSLGYMSPDQCERVA